MPGEKQTPVYPRTVHSSTFEHNFRRTLIHTNDNTIFLTKGQYLAPQYLTANFDELLIGITKYKTSIETGVWHSHEKSMISFVLYGSNTEYRNGKTTNRISGSTNYYYSHELHKNVYNQFPSKHISLELDYAFLKQYDYTEELIDLAVRKGQDSVFTFIKLMNEAMINDSQSSNTVEMLCIAFLENSLNSIEETQLPIWVKSVRDLLNDRWNENISLAELASNINIHPTTISKYFKRYFQCTLGEYTRKLKVVHSLDILHSSNHSLTETAYMCGFSDQSHFTRTFKLMTGYLPKDYIKT